VLAMLDYVGKRADIMVNSWSSLPYFVLSSPVVGRIRELSVSGGRRGKGVVFVSAAGNSNCPIHFSSDIAVPYEVSACTTSSRSRNVYRSKTFRNNLTLIPGVLHVAGVSSLAQRCQYSCYGPGIDLCAPSSNSRAFSDEPVKGLGLTTSTGDPNGVTHRFKGTSGSAALVAGVAALVLSANPSLCAAEVCDVLRMSASKDLDCTSKDPSGISPREGAHDIPPIPPFNEGRFDQGGWSPWFGYGKADALEAVAMTIG
jgi:hypothetical protein